MIVYNSNLVAVAPDSETVAACFAREDLFTIVLEHFQTGTADYVDLISLRRHSSNTSMYTSRTAIHM